MSASTEPMKELIAELARLRAIERRAEELSRGSDPDTITPQRAREIGVARYILTGQKH
jgi:hypothetical protein